MWHPEHSVCEYVWVCVCVRRRGKVDFDGDEYIACLGTVSTNKVLQGNVEIQTFLNHEESGLTLVSLASTVKQQIFWVSQNLFQISKLNSLGLKAVIYAWFPETYQYPINQVSGDISDINKY